MELAIGPTQGEAGVQSRSVPWRMSLCCLQAGGDGARKTAMACVWLFLCRGEGGEGTRRGDAETGAGKDSRYRLGFNGAFVGPEMGLP